jgi:hypothetical protein
MSFSIHHALDGALVAGLRRSMALALLALLALAAPALPAQEEAPPGTPARPTTALMTRAELEAQAARLEQEARAGGEQQQAEAAAIRERLRDGDFRVGDRLALRTEAPAGLPPELARALNDTLVVREGPALRLPSMPDLSLHGVLRSELAERLGSHVSAYLRGVTIRVEPALQGLLSGPVGRPGYVTLAPDMLVTDAMMVGGVSSQADLRRSVVKRDGEEIIGQDSLQAAVRAGATLDRIGFRSGDELAIGERKEPWNWMKIVQVVSVVGGLVLLALRLSRI